MTALDFGVIGAYLALVMGIGFYFSGRTGTAKGYFLAGRQVGWVAIGASLFATNISSEHLIGLAGAGATTGLACSWSGSPGRARIARARLRHC
jgi:SSS family solute:Na+ symporter